jgi:hypothetical protein
MLCLLLIPTAYPAGGDILEADHNVVQLWKRSIKGLFGVSQRKLKFNPELHFYQMIHSIETFSFELSILRGSRVSRG